MPDTTCGVVQNGKIIPQTPLPDGLQVHFTVPEGILIPDELQDEFDAWSLGNAKAFVMVEQLAEEIGRHEEG